MSDTLSTLKNYEPIRDNRFIVRFPSELNIQSWWVKSINLPSVSIDDKGNETWGDINISFKNFITPSTVQAISENLKPAKDFEFSIELVDPEVNPIQKWIIKAERVISIDFGGTADYDNDAIQETKVIFKINNCTLHY